MEIRRIELLTQIFVTPFKLFAVSSVAPIVVHILKIPQELLQVGLAQSRQFKSVKHFCHIQNLTHPPPTRVFCFSSSGKSSHSEYTFQNTRPALARSSPSLRKGHGPPQPEISNRQPLNSYSRAWHIQPCSSVMSHPWPWPRNARMCRFFLCTCTILCATHGRMDGPFRPLVLVASIGIWSMFSFVPQEPVHLGAGGFEGR